MLVPELLFWQRSENGKMYTERKNVLQHSIEEVLKS